jgi:hypothetical protein
MRWIGAVLFMLALGDAAHAACNPALSYSTTSRLSFKRPSLNQCNWGQPLQDLIDRLDQYACMPGVAACGLDLSTDTTSRLPLAKLTDDDTNANYCLLAGGGGGEPTYGPCLRPDVWATSRVPFFAADGRLTSDATFFRTSDTLTISANVDLGTTGGDAYFRGALTPRFRLIGDGGIAATFGLQASSTGLELRGTAGIADIQQWVSNGFSILTAVDYLGRLRFLDGSHISYARPYLSSTQGTLRVGPPADAADKRIPNVRVDSSAGNTAGIGDASILEVRLQAVGEKRLIVQDRPSPWRGQASYQEFDLIRPNPANGFIYWSNVAGTSGTTQPFATNANPNGWPWGWYPQRVYSENDRLHLLQSNGRRYRVTTGGTCRTGDGVEQSGAWWRPVASYLETGTCSGGANDGKCCNVIGDCPAGACNAGPTGCVVTDGTCSLVDEGTDAVTNISDGTLSWQQVDADRGRDPVTIGGGTDFQGIDLTHGDNTTQPMLSASRANLPATATVLEQETLVHWFGDERVTTPATQLWAEASNAARLGVIAEIGADAVFAPSAKPIVTAAGGGSPGLTQGCYYVQYAYDSNKTGNRTAPSPIDDTDGVYVDGATNNQINITIPLSAYPANVGNIAVFISNPQPWGTGNVCYRKPFSLFRSTVLTGGTLSTSWAGCPIGKSCEHESAYAFTATSQRTAEFYAGNLTTSWASATGKVVGDWILPLTRNGHVYRLHSAATGSYNGEPCTTGGGEPTWGTTPGGFTADGTCTWKEMGPERASLVLRKGTGTEILQFTEALNGAHTGRVLGGFNVSSGDPFFYLNKHTGGSSVLGQPAIRMGVGPNGGRIDAGAGAGGAIDVNLYRSAADEWTTDDKLNIAGKLRVDGGVDTNGAGIKHGRVTTGSISAGASAGVNLVWAGSSFSDTSYTANCSVQDATAGVGLRVDHIESKTSGSITARVVNGSGGSLTGTLHCIAMHD